MHANAPELLNNFRLRGAAFTLCWKIHFWPMRATSRSGSGNLTIVMENFLGFSLSTDVFFVSTALKVTVVYQVRVRLCIYNSFLFP
jgi:hypothetical protein